VAGITGSVIVELVIDAKGSVSEARAVKSVAELDEAAVKAARKWKYEPTLIGGKASEVVTYATIRFGQTMEPIPADWLSMAAFYYDRGLLAPARAALDSAIAKSRHDRARFGTFESGPRTPADGITGPVKTKDVRPQYPTSAQRRGIQAVVVIEALMDEQGNIGRARVMSQPSVLDAAALEAVLQWQFKPATRNGSPIAIVMTTTVNFSLVR
jgi:TonB family protein